MTDQYQRDIGEYLIIHLFEPEQRQFQRQVDRLVDDNDALVGELNEGFNYLGTNYGRNGRQGFMKAAILDYKLIPRMKQLVDFQKQMGNEKQLITQMIYKLITPCQSGQDLRDALPECLVQLLSEMYKALPTRKRDPAW